MTPTQSDEELSKKAILWVKANAPDLDMCCYSQEVTETEDGDLCINCRHIFWAAVRGYIAGQQELEAVKKEYWESSRVDKHGIIPSMLGAHNLNLKWESRDCYERSKQAQGGE